MANFEVPASYPNILLVYGTDVHTSQPDYRISLRDYLYNTNAPVGRGTHDFLITYAGNSLGGGHYTSGDPGITPRPNRGMIRMGDIEAPGNTDTFKRHLSVLTQEVTHYWLVPNSLKFEENGTEQACIPHWDLVEKINKGEPWNGVPLLARQGLHWSAYFNADNSPQDGVSWEEEADVSGYQVWSHKNFTGKTIAPPGLTPVDLQHQLNDLDLVIMGAKDKNDAYADSGGRFSWIEPKLTAPLPYYAGICVIFDQNKVLRFGFADRHNRLKVERTGSTPNFYTIGDEYDPLGNEFTGVALRIVRKGDTYYCQAKVDNPLTGCAVSIAKLMGRNPDKPQAMFDGIENPTPMSSQDLKVWRTVATRTISDTPLAIGAFVQKEQHSHMCELAINNFHIHRNGEERIIKTDTVPLQSSSPGNYGALQPDVLRVEIPRFGANVRTHRGRLLIMAPFSGKNASGQNVHFNDREAGYHFGWDESIDECPKVLSKAPTGDFAFGTNAKINRSLFTPWAGGNAAGKVIWGRKKSLPASGIKMIPEYLQKQPPPPNNNIYKCAFIIVAPNRGSITNSMIENLDKTRRYWDKMFEELTNGAFKSDSSL